MTVFYPRNLNARAFKLGARIVYLTAKLETRRGRPYSEAEALADWREAVYNRTQEECEELARLLRDRLVEMGPSRVGNLAEELTILDDAHELGPLSKEEIRAVSFEVSKAYAKARSEQRWEDVAKLRKEIDVQVAENLRSQPLVADASIRFRPDPEAPPAGEPDLGGPTPTPTDPPPAGGAEGEEAMAVLTDDSVVLAILNPDQKEYPVFLYSPKDGKGTAVRGELLGLIYGYAAHKTVVVVDLESELQVPRLLPSLRAKRALVLSLWSKALSRGRGGRKWEDVFAMAEWFGIETDVYNPLVVEDRAKVAAKVLEQVRRKSFNYLVPHGATLDDVFAKQDMIRDAVALEKQMEREYEPRKLAEMREAIDGSELAGPILPEFGEE